MPHGDALSTFALTNGVDVIFSTESLPTSNRPRHRESSEEHETQIHAIQLETLSISEFLSMPAGSSFIIISSRDPQLALINLYWLHTWYYHQLLFYHINLKAVEVCGWILNISDNLFSNTDNLFYVTSIEKGATSIQGYWENPLATRRR